MGRPFGIPREGTYGVGVETEVVRVPTGYKKKIPVWINDLPQLVSRYKKESKSTRNWVIANRLLEELEALLNEPDA